MEERTDEIRQRNERRMKTQNGGKEIGRNERKRTKNERMKYRERNRRKKKGMSGRNGTEGKDRLMKGKGADGDRYIDI
jgi:hypothetical protein